MLCMVNLTKPHKKSALEKALFLYLYKMLSVFYTVRSRHYFGFQTFFVSDDSV